LNEEIEEFLYREELELATIFKRAMAAAIDDTILSVLLVIILFDSLSSLQSAEQMVGFINSFMLEFITIKIIYHLIFTTLYGATAGKMVMKIRVIEISTATNPTWSVSLNRSIFRIVSEMFFYLGFLWGMMDPNRQTWQDKTAKTLVINA